MLPDEARGDSPELERASSTKGAWEKYGPHGLPPREEVEAQLPEEMRSAKAAEEQSEEWRGEAGSLGRRAVADPVKGGESLACLFNPCAPQAGMERASAWPPVCVSPACAPSNRPPALAPRRPHTAPIITTHNRTVALHSG